MKIISNVPKKINKEIIAGLTTFFTLSYLIILNPLIWNTPGTNISLSFALTATVLVLFAINLFAGFFIKLPYVFGPGIGLNAFIVYTIILAQKIPFSIALGMIFWSSILFILVSILPIRRKIIESLPPNMKHAICCGIGLFLAFIGLKNLNLIISNPNTLLGVGHLNSQISLGLFGFFLAFYLFIKNKSYAFLVSILVVTALSIATGHSQMPQQFFSAPDFRNIFNQIDIWGAFKLSFVPTILALFMTNLFDSISTIIALSHTSGLHDNKGQPHALKRILMVDSLGSIFASAVGTAPTAVYVESASGMQAGGRTGIVPIVVAICFLPCLFFEPIVRIIPAYATAPILIFIGILMSLHLKNIKVESFDDIVPVFITIILMPLTASITHGVIFGIMSYVILKALAGKFHEISRTLFIISLISLFVFLTSFTKSPVSQNFSVHLQTAQYNAQKNSNLTADFTQEFYSALRNKTTTSKGTLYLKDNLFRFEIIYPRPQLYVNDGKFIWKYEKEFHHAEKFTPQSHTMQFVRLLNNLENLETVYSIKEGIPYHKKTDSLNVILEPLKANIDKRKLNLFVQTKTGYVTELNLLDTNGNKTKFLFENFSKKKISSEKFVFVPPQGTIINTFKN